MPSRRIHFTGRKRLTAQDVKISLHNEAVPLTFEIVHLSLQRHGLPGDALVHIEAYQQSTYRSFCLGTVADLALPGRLALIEFDTPDAIRFRVKVTSVKEATDGQLLAVGDRIRPTWADGGQESLLPIKPDSSLDQEVFRLSLDDEPVLLINNKIARWRELSQDEHFVSLVYPTVFRTILTRILHEELTDPDDTDDWRSLWIQFAKTHLGIFDPPEDESDDGLLVTDWVDEAVAAFCKRNGIYDTFARRWDSEDDS